MGDINSSRTGCGGSEEKQEGAIAVEEEIVAEEVAAENAETFVNIWISANADSPNFLIKTICYDWMRLRHIQCRCNEVLAAEDRWDGDGEFVVALSPQWDPAIILDLEATLFEMDGWEMGNNDQALIAHTADFAADAWGEFAWEVSDEVLVVEAFEPIEQWE